MVQRVKELLASFWESLLLLFKCGKSVKVPDTENLAQIATRAGYTLEELLCCLEGRAVPETSDLTVILRQINHMPLSQVAQIVQAAAARLAAVAESASDEAKAS